MKANDESDDKGSHVRPFRSPQMLQEVAKGVESNLFTLISAHENRFAAETMITAPKAAEGTYTNKSDKNAVATTTIIAARIQLLS